MARKGKNGAKYCTDALARNLWLALVRDFRASEGLSFCRKAEAQLLAGMPAFREFEYPELGNMTIGRFKRYKQMESLLKKYRFAQDAHSDEELENITLGKYFQEQERLSTPVPQNQLSLKVAQRARAIARSILGPLPDLEDVILECKFGKKSSIGCSLSLAYIDEKLSRPNAFTGSETCSEWFHSQVLPGDEILREMVDKLGVSPQADQLKHETLTLISVPKTWKVHRTITPLTLLSLFYSYGIGGLVTKRLRESRLDIRRLQNRHRKLVKAYSMSLTHATADLSAASDSITIESLLQILPREWYRAVRPALTSQVVFERSGEQKQAYTASVLPMGNGLTFPVETLIFYCIIKAIGELTGVKGVYSVYGDDLIYPSRLHRYVVRIFPYFRLKLNLDKTFVRYPFRESCGADYYRGADVRPFYLQGQAQQLSRSRYQAHLYKVYNGLVRRWDPLEIRGTLRLLLVELLRVSDEILRVPPDFPDYAGILTDTPWDLPLGCENVPLSPIRFCTSGKHSGQFVFQYLMETPKRRVIRTQLPYYWLALQGRNDEVDEINFSKPMALLRHEVPKPPIIWRKRVYHRFYKRNGKTVRKKIVKAVPTVASRTGSLLSISYGSIHEWA